MITPQIARANRVTTGRKLSVDSTVVETSMHYLTGSSLLGDGARVLTRVMKQISATVAGNQIIMQYAVCQHRPAHSTLQVSRPEMLKKILTVY